jgi:hypothetical protein
MSTELLNKEKEWVKKYSQTRSLPYWYNIRTQKSVWENPLTTEAALGAGEREREGEGTKSEWQERYSSTHKAKYWYNPKTNKSVWKNPEDDTTKIDAHAKSSSSSSFSAAIEDKEDKDDDEQPRKKRRGDPSSSSSSSSSSESSASLYASKSIPVTSTIEDFPSLSLERERLRVHCHTILVLENAKFGPMHGNTKTAISCRRDGNFMGMQGIFARIMWHQLLCEIDSNGDIGSSIKRDGIFPMTTVADEDVHKELVDAGRSASNANKIIENVLGEMRKACLQLAEIRKIAASQEYVITLTKAASVIVEGVESNQKQFYNIQYKEKVFSISEAHLLKLLRLYQIHTDKSATIESNLFLRRAFCVIHRYESLSGASDGYQMAFPHAGFQWLRDNVGVQIECFASPLNCWNQRICSVAKDTDCFFGSIGNFFLFDGHSPTGKVSDDNPGLQLGGSFEANPPFVQSVMNRMAHHIEKILTTFADRDDVPFSFSVIVPAWTDCEGITVMTNSKFLKPHPKYVLRLEKRKHNYRPGMQHRATHEEQPSNVDTLVFFLQNNAGAKRWPVTVKLAETLQQRLIEDSK